MGPICTCGAKPPDDAQFCHRCGRPLFAAPPPEVEETAPAIPAVEPGPKPIGFSNTNAVLIALLTAIVMYPLVALSARSILIVFVLGAGGFGAVAGYNRRTGQSLSVVDGARMGWLIGVIFSGIGVVLFAFLSIAVEQQGGWARVMEMQARAANMPEAEIRAAVELVQSPMQFVFSMIMAFMLFTLPMIVGGAVAAKMLDRGSSEA